MLFLNSYNTLIENSIFTKGYSDSFSGSIYMKLSVNVTIFNSSFNENKVD